MENFCNKKSIILNNDIKNIIHNQLLHNYQYEQVNIEKLTNINNITSNYLLTIEKQNKYDFLLFLTTIKNNKYSVFIVNYNNQLYFYSVKFRFNHDLYTGTLFKGELAKNDKNCWIYFISNIIYYKNKYVYNTKLSNKIKIIANILKNEYLFDDYMNACHLQIKSYFLFNHIPFIKKNCRLILIPEHINDKQYFFDIKFPTIKPIVYQNNEQKKFKIKKTNVIDVYELYNIKTNIFDSIICISKLSTSIFLKKKFENINSFIIDVKYSTYFKSWIPAI